MKKKVLLLAIVALMLTVFDSVLAYAKEAGVAGREEKEAFERMLEDAFPDEDKASLMESVMALGDDMDEETFRQMMEGAFSEMNQEPSSEEEPQILNP